MFDYLHTTFFGTFQRMVFWELLRVFLMSLVGLTALFVIVGAVQQATQLGLSLGQVIAVIPYLVPTSFPYTIPTTMLFASCVAYGRLSHDNEAVVLKAAGVDLYSLLRPALFLGLIAAAFTAALSYRVIPQCVRAVQEEALRDPEETIYAILRREKTFKSANSQWVLYVKDVQGRRLIDVVLKQRKKNSAEGGYDLVARARQARLKVDIDRNELTVADDESDNAWTVVGSSSDLQSNNNKPQTVPLPAEFQRETLLKQLAGRPQALDWPDLLAKARWWMSGPEGRDAVLRIREAILDIPPAAVLDAKALLELDTKYGWLSVPVLKKDGTPERWPNGEPMLSPSGRISPDPAKRPEQAQHYADVAKFAERNSRTVELEWYMRPALAFGCVIFALIGCPVGMWANRGDYLSIFVVCFLPTLFSYYPILLSGAGFARDGKVPMVAGVWVANALGLLVGTILTWRLVKR